MKGRPRICGMQYSSRRKMNEEKISFRSTKMLHTNRNLHGMQCMHHLLWSLNSLLLLWGRNRYGFAFESIIWIYELFLTYMSHYYTSIMPSSNKDPIAREDSTSVCLLYGQLSQGRMDKFLAFIASKYFDLETIIYLKWNDINCGTFWCIKKYMIVLKMCFSVNQIDDLHSSNKRWSWTFRLPFLWHIICNCCKCICQ